MENLYDTNGLVFWDEGEIRLRNMFEDHFLFRLQQNLKEQNRGFEFFKCEATLLTPRNLINPNYTDDDVFIQGESSDAISDAYHKWLADKNAIEQDAVAITEKYGSDMMTVIRNMHGKDPYDAADYIVVRNVFIAIKYHGKELVLRPETTMGSYAYARHLFNPHGDRKVKPPIVVYQHGKSFRREQDQATKNMRLKEFYQLEFQIIYSQSTKNDYSVTLIPTVAEMISEMIGLCRIEDSDRLPDYAEWTKDIICNKTNMEVCSISKRTDFEGMHVLEVAIGTDRCVYNFKQKDTFKQIIQNELTHK